MKSLLLYGPASAVQSIVPSIEKVKMGDENGEREKNREKRYPHLRGSGYRSGRFSADLGRGRVRRRSLGWMEPPSQEIRSRERMEQEDEEQKRMRKDEEQKRMRQDGNRKAGAEHVRPRRPGRARVWWIGLLAAGLLCTGCAGLTAERIQLMKTEGKVDIANSRGKEVTPVPEMKLYSGYDMMTQKESYAWINLDSVKLAKMDASSQIHINKKSKGMEVVVDSGNLFFNIKEPLGEDETLDIRTANMAVGIRGTCGWVEVLDEEHMLVYILEGTVQCKVDAPSSREKKEASVSGGQVARLTIDPEAEKGKVCAIQTSDFTVEEIAKFVLEELTGDAKLCAKIYEASGLEIHRTGGTSEEDGVEEDGAEDGVEDVGARVADAWAASAKTSNVRAASAEDESVEDAGAEDESAGDESVEDAGAEDESAGDESVEAASVEIMHVEDESIGDESAGAADVEEEDAAETAAADPGGWQQAYLAVLEDQRAENEALGDPRSELGGWNYQLYDIDKDGIPELYIHFGVTEAAARADIYTYQSGAAVLLQKAQGMAHVSLYTWPGENAIAYAWSHMGYSSLQKVSLVNGQLTSTTIFEGSIEDGSSMSVEQIVPGAVALEKCRIEQDTLLDR